MRTSRLFLITGVSGSGKSTVVSVFEDLGFYCVDNLPAQMIGDFVRYLESDPDSSCSVRPGYALLLDCRTVDLSGSFVLAELSRLSDSGVEVCLLFLECQDDVVLRRYQETRRPHPLILEDSTVATMSEALQIERVRLGAFRERADRIIDTSNFSPHDLRRAVEELLGSTHNFNVEVCSFGFKFGVPLNADLVLDVRFLPNPHFVPELRNLTGMEKAVSDFVFRSGEADALVSHYTQLLEFLLPKYKKEGKYYLLASFGCTGGRHRSVSIANRMAESVSSLGYQVTVTHRDKHRC